MALKTNEQYQSNTPDPTPPVDAHRIMPKVLAADAAEPTLARLTMMGFNTVTGFYQQWDPAGADGVEILKALTWPDEVTLHPTDESIAQLLIRGVVRREDVVVGPNIVASAAQIDDELRLRARDLGIDVQNLTQVR